MLRSDNGIIHRCGGDIGVGQCLRLVKALHAEVETLNGQVAALEVGVEGGSQWREC